MKLLFIKIIVVLLVFNRGCRNKAVEITKPKPTSKVIKSKKTKDTIVSNNGFLSELKFQKDSIYFINHNISKKLVFIDTKTQNGFIRKYYCKNELIDSLTVTESKIQNGLFLDGEIEGNEVIRLTRLTTFKNYKKSGVHIGFDVSTISSIGMYKNDKEEGQWLYYYTNGKWSGMVCDEQFDNGISISKNCDYYDWENKLNTKLSEVNVKIIKCLSNY